MLAGGYFPIQKICVIRVIRVFRVFRGQLFISSFTELQSRQARVEIVALD